MHKPMWARQANAKVRQAVRRFAGKNPYPMPAQDRSWVLAQLPHGEAGAEVGVWQGDFSAELLHVVEPARLELIDPWLAASDREHRGSPYSRVSQNTMDRIYRQVVERFADDARVTVWRTPSVDASRQVGDGTLGWVYVDGDHSYAAVVADLEAWSPKVRPGGVIAGDDYLHGSWFGDGVIRAVHEFAERTGWELATAGTQFVMRRPTSTS